MSDITSPVADATPSRAIQAQFEREFDFIHVFERNARRFANKIAASDPTINRLLTYAQLNALANKFANALYSDGLRKGDVFSVALFNTIEFIVAYLASEKLGAVFCPFNYNWSPNDIVYAFADSRPKIFLYDAELEELVKRAYDIATQEHSYLPERRLIVGVPEEKLNVDAIDWEEYYANASEENPATPDNVSTYDEIVRLYTSGTTGRSKGVPLSRMNEVMGCHEVAMRYPIFSDDVTINTTPWFHRGGFHGGMTPTLYLGGEVVVLRRFNATVCLKNIQKRRVTILLGVPSAALMVAHKQEKALLDIKSVRLLVMMGSDLEKATCRYLQSIFLNVNFINSYGTTETFLNTFLDSKSLPDKAGTAGRAALDDDVRLVEPIEDGWGDPDKLVPKDKKTLGEVIVRCSTKTTAGYFNKPEETARKFKYGYLYTGDLAYWDEEEFVTIVGRKDDMMISAGENIYPQPIEEALCRHPKISDCIVVPVSEMTRGQALVAYIKRSDDSLDVREILTFCMSSPYLSGFTTPRYYRFVEELPYTPTGKKQRYILRAQAPQDLKDGLLARN
ncbi:MAG: class I adenylate-forming enzyme family protein [Planctomycetia bacterium]|nr:class I adenylate-forming enzyme family protein [Planctomycetia bacterium]